MQIIPLSSVPSQTVTVTLGGQVCTINVYQKFFGVFLDLYVNGVLLVAGGFCENANPVIRYAYLGFIGDLEFFDMQGTNDPFYTGIGARWQLVYLEPADIVAINENYDAAVDLIAATGFGGI
jgi:hypothetical protein